MKIDEKRYAMERVRNEATRKKNVLREKLTSALKPLTGKDKLKLICNGSVEVHRQSRLKADMPLIDAFDFQHEEPRDELDSKAFSKGAGEISKQRDIVLDEIMLGDRVKAIRLIKEFCKS